MLLFVVSSSTIFRIVSLEFVISDIKDSDVETVRLHRTLARNPVAQANSKCDFVASDI